MRGALPGMLIAMAASCAGGSGRYGSETLGPPNQGRVVVPSYGQGQVPSGTKLWLQLDHRIDLSRARRGDAVAAHVVQEVEDASGAVLIPRGAVVEGRIVEISGQPAVARVKLDSLTIGERSQPLFATVIRLGDRPAQHGSFPVEPAVAAATPMGIRPAPPVYGLTAITPFGLY